MPIPAIGSKEEGKYQEWIQLSTKPDQGHLSSFPSSHSLNNLPHVCYAWLKDMRSFLRKHTIEVDERISWEVSQNILILLLPSHTWYVSSFSKSSNNPVFVWHWMKKCKWVWSENATTTHCRPTQCTTRKKQGTHIVTWHHIAMKGKATSSQQHRQ